MSEASSAPLPPKTRHLSAAPREAATPRGQCLLLEHLPALPGFGERPGGVLMVWENGEVWALPMRDIEAPPKGPALVQNRQALEDATPKAGAVQHKYNPGDWSALKDDQMPAREIKAINASIAMQRHRYVLCTLAPVLDGADGPEHPPTRVCLSPDKKLLLVQGLDLDCVPLVAVYRAALVPRGGGSVAHTVPHLSAHRFRWPILAPGRAPREIAACGTRSAASLPISMPFPCRG